jgi:hypothetical protein
MKCPACWAEKAYRRNEEGALPLLLRCLFFVPMRCRHCYHKFWVHRLSAWGAVIEPPPKPAPTGPVKKSSVAALHLSQARESSGQSDAPPSKAA